MSDLIAVALLISEIWLATDRQTDILYLSSSMFTFQNHEYFENKKSKLVGCGHEVPHLWYSM